MYIKHPFNKTITTWYYITWTHAKYWL